MRIIALMAFWDESPLWLNAAVTSAAPHVDHVVAVDGRYALYPGEHVFSRSDQACAIVETCQAANLGLTLHRPSRVWEGNETEKRTRLFRLGDLAAEPGDWFMVLDTDEVIIQCPTDLKDRLAATDRDAADVLFMERGDPYADPHDLVPGQRAPLVHDKEYGLTMLFRATPGITVGPTHYTYRLPDGRRVWDGGYRAESALNLRPHFRVEHRTFYRPQRRSLDAQEFYRARDEAGIESRQTL